MGERQVGMAGRGIRMWVLGTPPFVAGQIEEFELPNGVTIRDQNAAR